MKKLLIIFFNSITHFAFGQESKTYLFVGTYTDGKADKGIYIYEFNSKTGRLKKVSTGDSITNPSFLTLSPNGSFIYACTYTKLPNARSVTDFKFDSITGSLSFKTSKTLVVKIPPIVNLQNVGSNAKSNQS